ncbi:NAD(P)/FAD-dependent oxidoreductase [Stenotrophomonas mori]|uniref:FAD-binding oxidoreductase n=1 Tax=Stenotrophomonas mori TaxID=2871096 RepID=A0ABT0SGZ4_9GAMM|nr:FAD-dependent oxidoreductase [Stenotrophomonas mori]MCL7714547.1 FAD-binding oxidoreductase [Stenotrophomonas mori]
MDLKSGYPFWAIRNGLMHAYPPLHAPLRCEVLVVGGGITGALIADDLARHGHGVAVVEQRDIGWGSSAASTALLQYEIDTHMVVLARRYGEDAAVLAYRACAEAILQLQDRAADVRGVDFRRGDSLYYASHARHRAVLHAEYALRRKHGFAVHWLEPDAIRAAYGFQAPAALLSDLAASLDPYRMTHRLLRRVCRNGGQVFDRTTIARLQPARGGILAVTSDGLPVHCGHVVMAAGYAGERWIDTRVARNRSSYAFVTDPLPAAALGPLRRTMLWESARPYLYLRSTADRRLLVGGEDDAVDLPARRDARVDRKAQRLVAKVRQLFPDLPLVPAFAWAGTFAETADGLPFFGAHPHWGPRVLFAMAYGGNGITYSMLGAGLLRATLERRPHPLAALFGFSRLD